jgi:hypothetical protein
MAESDNLHRLPRGGYQVWFLTFTDPRSGQGFWIRSTRRAPRDEAPEAAAWFARFDPVSPERTFAIHRRFDDAGFATEIFDTRIGPVSIRSGHASGELAGGGHRARWRLWWPTGEETYRLLPDWLYGSGRAPTLAYAPNPDTRVTGEVEVDGTSLALEEAPGQQGHLVGTRHAERWAWVACGAFEGQEGAVQALTAQGRVGRVRTPFLTQVGVRWDGRWIRIRKVSPARDFALGTWRLDVSDRYHRLTGRVEAPARDLVRARYLDPDGSERFCHNSEVASCRLAFFERRRGRFEQVALFQSRGGAHAEWAGRTPAPAVRREHVDVSAEPVGSGAGREGGVP